MSSTNTTSATTNQNDLSAYFASFLTPVLSQPATSTWASGAAYSYTITAPAAQDYLVSNTTYTAQLGTMSYTPFPACSLGCFTLVQTLTVTNGVISGTLPTVTTPTTYTIQLTATNANNVTGTTISYTITVNPPPPTVSGITPASGPTTGGTSVTITGTNFTGATAVKFGATNATSYVVNSATKITAAAPPGVAGTVDIKVTNPGGTSTAVWTDQFTYVAPPTVTGITPASGPTTGGTSVTITGTNFTGATAVKFGTTNATGYVVNSATQITATAPAGTGIVDITVTIPGGGPSAAVWTDQFTYVTPPTVTGITPASGPTTGGTSVTITGTNFTGATAVKFGTTNATGYVVNSATQITATAPAGTGIVDITVTIPGGGPSAAVWTDQFTYVTPPTVTGITPASGPTSGGTAITISGTNFVNGSTTVTIGGVAAVINSVSATSISATTSITGTAGAQDVVVTTPGGPATVIAAFTYWALPTVTGVSPNSGPSTGGTTITINGSNFVSGNVSVTVGGVAATNVTWVTSSQITASTPAGTSGTTVDVIVTSTGGSSTVSASDKFTYGTAPTVTSVSPSSGPTTGGTSVTINGANLTGATVKFGATSATINSNNGSQIIATAPVGAAGTVDVTVVTACCTSAITTADQFTYVTAPAITSANSATGSGGSAFSYTITATQPPITGYSVTTAAGQTGLPAGLSVNTVNGTISGTPTVNGTFTATINATNAAGTGSATLTINLSATTPVITSAPTAAGSGGTPFNYQILASNVPTSYNATNLPTGLTIDTATGKITGTPTVNGTFNATISATNAAGTGFAPLVITLNPTTPAITSALTASGSGGTAFSYQITASNVPTSYNATGLPAGLSVNTSTGLISGTPTVNGTFNASITASNAAGTSPAVTLAITLTATAPVLTSTTAASGSGGAPFSYQITANNVPTSYSATGLPAGLTVDTATGLISGTPTVNGTYNVTISAINGAGASTATLTITLSATIPVITSALTVAGSGGAAFNYQITASNVPTSYNATGLPAGLTVNTTTGLISGTPTVNGIFNVTITASNAAGTSPAATLAVTLSAIPPGITSATTATGTGGVAFSYQITASNVPTSYNATGLPTGLSVNTATGLISGTPANSGTFNATISASNAAGTGSATLKITLGSLPTTVAATTMTVKLNTAATIDLAPFITGTAITGINIVAAVSHGTTTVSGTKVTYTPANDYFGTDTFKYVAYGSGGTSAAAAVTITIVGRPDPTKDANVAGLINSHTSVADRFWRAQLSNFQQRIESRHHALESDTLQSSLGAKPKTFAGYEGATANAMLAGSQMPAGAVSSDSNGVPDISNEGSGVLSYMLASTMVSALQSSSVNLATFFNKQGHGSSSDLEIWGAGNVRYGNKNQLGGGADINFTTDGISLGADRRFGDQLTLGMGIGYGHDKSTIGNDGTGSTSSGSSVAGYASYQYSSTMFIDGLLGYGALNMDTTRYVAPVAAFANASRGGSQVFGSLSTGYEYRDENFLMSPYLRYDLAVDRLRAATERGAGLYALNYGDQSTRSSLASLGLRAESKHQTGFGWAAPRARIEYQRQIMGNSQATISYADQFNSSQYVLAVPTINTNSLLLGVGSGFLMEGGFKLDVDYQRVHSTGRENNQGINLRFTKALD